MLNWVRRHPYLLLSILLFAILAVPFLRKRDSQWDNVYLRAASHLQAGQDMFKLEDGYLYPPFMAWLAIPFTYLSQDASRVAWYLISIGSMVLLWRWAWTVSGGQTSGWFHWDRAEHLICGLGLACAFRYGIDCLQNQQTDLVIAALLLGGCVALSSSRSLLAATCFGLAAGMKCTALLWMPYMVYRREWRAALWIPVVAVMVNLIPNLTCTPPGGGWWLGEWVERYLLLMAREDYRPGIWGSAVVLNQSLAGAAYRWFMTSWSWETAGVLIFEKADGPSPRVLKLAVYGFQLVLLAVTAAAMGWRRPASGCQRAVGNSLEYGAVLILMVLLSPMSSKPHFAILLLPAFSLARAAIRQRSRLLAALLGLALLSEALSIKDIAGNNLATLAMWYGGVTWSGLFLLAGCIWIVWQRKETVTVLHEKTTVTAMAA